MNPTGATAPLDLTPIAACVDAGNCSLSACRAALALGADAVHAAFEQGVPALHLLAGRTAVVDLVLTRLWKRAGPLFDDMALVAVGGYGRAELQPRSDIDITILLPPVEAGSTGEHDSRDEALSHWVTALWDLGLQIGHSVRTVEESAHEAQADITVVTNLMESRLIAGAPNLLAEMRLAIAPERMWDGESFFLAKIDEREVRRRRFGANAYRLEPDVKQSEGGLRDIQTIAWVCQRHFGHHPGSISELAPLVDEGLLEAGELDRLREGLELVWRIRYLLHHFAGRTEDRLLFDYQRRIAEALGYADGRSAHDNGAIEALMQHYYRTVIAQQRLTGICLQGIGGIVTGVTAATVPVRLNPRFQLRNGYLETTSDDVFLHRPSALLELFLVFARTPDAMRVRSHCVRLLRAHLKLVNDRFRSDPAVRAMFVEIFRQPHRLTRTIRLMNRTGVLAAYLPAFDAIVGRMQYDLFHVYTVDEHTLNVIRNLRRFSIPRHDDELPLCSAIAQRFDKPWLLYLVGLFHDIAKGRDGDHSELGAIDMHDFALAHGFDEHDTGLMVWAVRNHLIMSMTAQRRDIDDPDIQLEFAQQVGSMERLDFLYVLTVADIRATNPELWNSFKQSLLQALYRHTRLILERGLDDALARDSVIANRQAQTRTLLPDDLDPERVAALWSTLGADYFGQYQAAEIARHTALLLAHEDPDTPLVSLEHSPARGAAELLIHVPDDDALFALIATVLESLGLNVLSATIGTTDDGRALDTYNVLESGGTLIQTDRRLQEIRQALLSALGAARTGRVADQPATERLPPMPVRRASRRLQHFTVATEIAFAARDETLTEVRIIAADRPGVLSAIGRAFLETGVAVHAARITTLGERIDDVFFVSDGHDRAIDDPALRERLREALAARL